MHSQTESPHMIAGSFDGSQKHTPYSSFQYSLGVIARLAARCVRIGTDRMCACARVSSSPPLSPSRCNGAETFAGDARCDGAAPERA